MSDSQPTHKVVYNDRRTYLNAKGYMTEGSFEVVPIDEENYGQQAEGKKGTFEECQTYANQLNEGEFSDPGESLRSPFGKDDKI